MTNVRFSGTNDGVLVNTAYKASKTIFEAPYKVEHAVDEFVAAQAKKGGVLNHVAAFGAKQLGGLAQKLLSHDYHEFPEVALGKLRFRVAEPPIGALMLLLYPFTMGPRLYRAYQRSEKPDGSKDTREVFDVLRRDGIAITIFLFMLKPLLKLMNRTKQAVDGLQLYDKKADAVLSYSQFANYKIDSAKAITAILREGNAKGFLNAIKTLNDNGLAKAGGDKALGEKLDVIKKLAPEVVDAYKLMAKSIENQRPDAAVLTAKFNELAETLYQHLDDSEQIRNDVVKVLEKGGSKELLNAAKKLQGEFKDVLVNYAKTRRLPQDIASFIIVIGAIGWFPVWFNSIWNKKKFEEEQALKRAADSANFDPAQAAQLYAALKQSSRPANRFMQAG